jgi:hypothetical protein
MKKSMQMNMNEKTNVNMNTNINGKMNMKMNLDMNVRTNTKKNTNYCRGDRMSRRRQDAGQLRRGIPDAVVLWQQSDYQTRGFGQVHVW